MNIWSNVAHTQRNEYKYLRLAHDIQCTTSLSMCKSQSSPIPVSIPITDRKGFDLKVIISN